MDSYDPLEIVYQLRACIEKSLSSLDTAILDEEKARYRTVIEIIDRFEKLHISIPEDITSEKVNLLKKISTPNEEKRKLTDLANELSSLAKNIKRQLKGMRGSKTTSDRKAPPKGLRITFPDGMVFCENKATDTFVKTIQYAGLKRVSELQSIRALGHPLVSTQKNESAGNVRELDGYYIETRSSTEAKAKHIRDIASNLNIDIMVNIIEK